MQEESFLAHTVKIMRIVQVYKPIYGYPLVVMEETVNNFVLLELNYTLLTRIRFDILEI